MIKWEVTSKKTRKKKIIRARTAYEAAWIAARSKKKVGQWITEQWLDHDLLQAKNIIVLGYDTKGKPLMIKLPKVES